MSAMAYQNYRRLDCFHNRFFRRRSKEHQSSASLAFARGIHRWPVISPHKGPVTRIFFPFDDVIMGLCRSTVLHSPHHGQNIDQNFIDIYSIAVDTFVNTDDEVSDELWGLCGENLGQFLQRYNHTVLWVSRSRRPLPSRLCSEIHFTLPTHNWNRILGSQSDAAISNETPRVYCPLIPE